MRRQCVVMRPVVHASAAFSYAKPSPRMIRLPRRMYAPYLAVARQLSRVTNGACAVPRPSRRRVYAPIDRRLNG